MILQVLTLMVSEYVCVDEPILNTIHSLFERL